MIPVLVTLIHNAALLLAMMVVFDLVTSRKTMHGQWHRQILAGVILGGLCIGLMIASFQLETGIIFDTRSVLLSLSGLFLGPIPTVFAMAMAAAYRLWHGGAGVWTGLWVILATGGIGILWRHYRPGRLADISVRELYGFGVVVHLVMLALMLTLPWEAAQRVLAGIGLPVMLVYPIATIALGWLLANRLQRENATNALTASEMRYRSVFDAANVGKSVTLPTGEIDVNRAFCDMLGYSPEELRSKTWQELTPPEEIGSINEILASLMSGEKDAERFEKRYIHKNGSYVWADVSTTVQRGRDGNPLHFITTVVDITEQKQTEKSLVESEKRYRSLFENMNVGFVLFEVVQDGRGVPVDLIVLAANEGFAATTGLIIRDAIGTRLTQVLPGIEKDAADWIGTYSKVALTGEPRQFEQGSELLGYYYSVSAFQAAPKQCAVTFVDITGRKNAEKDLANEANRRRVLME
ncbi:MAG: PAS domain S-box protein, partial [Verrucomicrobia bacterium]|nr:PAS domain S-box protein [Verrucomicrobiota bacterium]